MTDGVGSDCQLLAEVLARSRAVVGSSETMVPLHAPEFRGREWEYLKDCLDSGWVSSVGAYVDRFEQMAAEAAGTRHAVAVANGTTALQIALMVAGVRAGDEVLVPALTFVATANAVCHVGAVPHFVDSEPTTLGIDAAALADRIGQIAEPDSHGGWRNRVSGRRLAAVIPMHVFGFPADMGAISAVAEAHNLAVVEDAAEALGSQWQGRPCGSLGRIAALSFNGNKILTTGGGGAIVTNDSELARRAKHLTTTAKLPHRWAFNHDMVAFNYRLPNLNAALGCAQFEQLAERLTAKRALAERYAAAFAGLCGAAILREPDGTRANYWLITLLLDEGKAHLRDALLDALNNNGLMARPVWTLMHRLPMFRECPRAPLPVAEALDRRIINLPSSAILGRMA